MNFKISQYLSLFPLVGVLFATSCKEFIEPSISKKNVVLLAPVDKYQSTKYNVNFWWEYVEDALNYRLQIVTPKFDSIGSLIVDTLVSSDKFSITLEPGDYQWRVSAENGSTQTPYSIRSFTVIETDLAEQTVALTSPADNFLTNKSNIDLVWGELFGADKYLVQIDTNGVTYEIPTTGQKYNLLFNTDNVYNWRVQAQNESGTERSKWSKTFHITYDHTPPQVVTLATPLPDEGLPKPFDFTWNAVADAEFYKLYVYKNNGTTIYSDKFPMKVLNTKQEFNLGNSAEKIYWQVTAVDKAGNESGFSEKRSVTVQ